VKQDASILGLPQDVLRAKEVRMALSGSGTVTVDGTVSGTPRSYQLVSTRDIRAGSLTATVSAGVQAYSFTFG
jgi:hypothetical protein